MIDLTLLKKLVAELESQLSLADSCKDNDKVIQYSKALGLCVGINSESSLLMQDIMHLSASGQNTQEMAIPLTNIKNIKGSN
ncbi:MAG: hypothetical protein LC122_12345 [Chitinophagales bacterium]|nr:hypothetical protein [Chitinophagales bacterium]